MQSVRRLAASAGIGLAAFMAIGTGPAVAAAPQMIDLTYTVNNLPATQAFSVSYFRPTQSINGSVQPIGFGWFGTVTFTTVNVSVSAWSSPVSLTINDWVQVSSPTVTGTVSLPQGATAVVVNGLTGQQSTLSNGSLSIPSGVGGLGATLGAPGSGPPPLKGGTQTIRCKGSAARCTASVPIAGGASNRKVVIRLTDTNLQLLSVKAVPRSSQGAYLLTNGRLTLGGSQYVVRLDAVRANPKGSHIVLTFGTGH